MNNSNVIVIDNWLERKEEKEIINFRDKLEKKAEEGLRQILTSSVKMPYPEGACPIKSMIEAYKEQLEKELDNEQ